MNNMDITKLVQGDFRLGTVIFPARNRVRDTGDITAEVIGEGLIIKSLRQKDSLFQLRFSVQGSAGQQGGRNDVPGGKLRFLLP